MATQYVTERHDSASRLADGPLLDAEGASVEIHPGVLFWEIAALTAAARAD
jgi:hypothetical protein